MLIERNLSVHPDTRTQVRILAAQAGKPMRYVLGELLDTFAASLRPEAIDPLLAPTRKRVSLVAEAQPKTWQILDDLRSTRQLTWNDVVDHALKADLDGDAR